MLSVASFAVILQFLFCATSLFATAAPIGGTLNAGPAMMLNTAGAGGTRHAAARPIHVQAAISNKVGNIKLPAASRRVTHHPAVITHHFSTLDRYASSSAKHSRALKAVAKTDHHPNSADPWAIKNVENGQIPVPDADLIPFREYWHRVQLYYDGAVPPKVIAGIMVRLIDAWQNRNGVTEFDVCCTRPTFDGVLVPDHFGIVPIFPTSANMLHDRELSGDVNIVFHYNADLSYRDIVPFQSPAQIKYYDFGFSDEADLAWSLGVILYRMLSGGQHPLAKLRQENGVDTVDDIQDTVDNEHTVVSETVGELHDDAHMHSALNDDVGSLHDKLSSINTALLQDAEMANDDLQKLNQNGTGQQADGFTYLHDDLHYGVRKMPDDWHKGPAINLRTNLQKKVQDLSADSSIDMQNGIPTFHEGLQNEATGGMEYMASLLDDQYAKLRHAVRNILERNEELPIPYDDSVIAIPCFVNFDDTVQPTECDSHGYDQLIALTKHCLQTVKENRIKISRLRNLLDGIVISEHVKNLSQNGHI